MAPTLFITGTTGYIGGDILYAVSKAHPEYEITALVRTQQKADQVTSAYPSVKTILGDLDDSKVLKEQAAKADIVIHTADSSDHEGAAKAIAAGLLEGHSVERPAFWLHVSGTGILMWEDVRKGQLGERSEKQYNDWTGVDELVNLPDDAFHRNVDKIVLEAGIKHGDVIKTAIVCPPTIYGKGRGPSLTRSRQAYLLTETILTKKFIPILGKGQARWNGIHVADLSDIFVLLSEAATSQRLDDELWGQKGYYLAEDGEFVWGELANAIGAQAAQLGYTEELKEGTWTQDEAAKEVGMEAVSWGLNARGKSERAAKLLGWKPSRISIQEEIPNILKDEYERLQQK